MALDLPCLVVAPEAAVPLAAPQGMHWYCLQGLGGVGRHFYLFPASLSSFDYPVLLYFSSQSFLTLRYVGVGKALTHCVSELPTSGKVPKGVSLLKATAAAYIKAYSCQKSLLVMKQSDFLNFLHDNDQLSLLMDDLEDFCMKSSSSTALYDTTAKK